jgi:hypothetical protein
VCSDLDSRSAYEEGGGGGVKWDWGGVCRMAQRTTNQDGVKQRCATKSAVTPVLDGRWPERGMDMRDGDRADRANNWYFAAHCQPGSRG